MWLGWLGLAWLGSLILGGSSLFLGGCFLDRSGTMAGDDAATTRPDAQVATDGGGRDAGNRDAGNRDAGNRDAGNRDSGPEGVDAGRRDAGPAPVDSGPTCTPADERCAGETAIRCEASVPTMQDCAATSAFCDASSRPTCVAWVCTPGASACSVDLASISTCDARGTGASSTACSRGCTAGACRPPTGCGDTVDATMSLGSMSFDTCANADDYDYADVTGDGCSGSRSNGGDYLVRFEVDRAGSFRFTLADDDASARVDPVVYVRSVCDSGATQLGCDDDTPGSRTSSLDLDLAAGDYFVIVDTLEWNPSSGSDYVCGNVRLTIARL